MHIKKILSFLILACTTLFYAYAYNPLAEPTSKWYKEGLAYQKTVCKQTKNCKTTASGLSYVIIKKGNKHHPKPTDTVKVHYEGSLINGNVFDSSYKRKAPIEFKLNQVIPGWTEGLQLIGEGGEITLYIPPDLAYGGQKLPGIPANSTLIFSVKLLKVIS